VRIKRVKESERRVIRFYLDLMAVKHLPVKEHCKRVGIYSCRVAKRLGKDTKAAYLAGMFHDLGKLLLDSDLFSERQISDAEYQKIKEHPFLAYSALSHLMPFTALCCGFHHAMAEKGGYGLSSKDLPERFGPRTVRKLLEIAEIVSICDFIDAFLNRKTGLKGKTEADTDLKAMLLNRFPESDEIVEAALAVIVK
jgi:hypothetical protein